MKIKKREQNMGDFLIVSLAEELQAYEDLAQEYQVGFETMIFMIRLCLKIRNEEKILYRNIRRPGFRQEARCMGRSMMCRCLVTTHRSARSQNFVCDRAWRLPKNFR